MRFSLLAAASTLLGLTAAQSGTATSSAATPSGSVKAHVVMASNINGSLTFSPETITAAVGDLVQFHFYPRNHSLAQSTFDNPCQPMPQTNGTIGFWSGFMPVTSESTTMPVFSVVVKDTAPMWFYCATGKHCQAGMAGVINPPANPARTIEAYKAAAALVAQAGVPNTAGGTGGSTTGGSTPTTGGGASATNGSASATGTGANAANGLVVSYWYSAMGMAVGALVVAVAF